MLDILLQPEVALSLVTLLAMEIVLGIDNIVFISILTAKLPASEQPSARRLGLGLALLMRLGLLFAITWVMGLTAPLLEVLGKTFSGRDLILLVGGLFLLAKATHEIYDKLEGAHESKAGAGGKARFGFILLQILLLDLVFSLDSVITAVGMVEHVSVMVIAMVGSVAFMLLFARSIGEFIQRHPSAKILALSFLLLIGAMLAAEGMGQHIAKGTIYFAMAFSVGVELLNLRLRKKRAPVTLHNPFEEQATKAGPEAPH